MKTHDVAIVGAGPAGVAAAVQLVRHGITPTVFEKEAVGGLLRNAWLVENCPGFAEGLPGRELTQLLARQLASSGVSPVREEVTSLDRVDGAFVVRTDNGDRRFRRVVVASGTRPRDITDIEIEAGAEDLVVREVWPLDGTSAARVAVVGGGDAALDHALALAAANTVTLLMRGDAPSSIPPLVEHVRDCRDIELLAGTRLLSVARAAGGGLKLACRTGESEVEIAVDHLVVAIGRVPETGFLSDTVVGLSRSLEERSELMFAGDVKSGIFRQAAIASGQGTEVAMRVARSLSTAARQEGEKDGNMENAKR